MIEDKNQAKKLANELKMKGEDREPKGSLVSSIWLYYILYQLNEPLKAHRRNECILLNNPI